MAYFRNVLIVALMSNFILGGFSAEFPENDEKITGFVDYVSEGVREKPDRLEELFQKIGLNSFQVIGIVAGLFVAECALVLILKRLRKTEEAECTQIEEGECEFKYFSHRNIRLPKVIV